MTSKKMRLKFTLTKSIAKKQKVKTNFNAQGIYLWIGSSNVVERVVGFHPSRGFIADYAYYTGNHWIKDLWLALFKWKKGFVRLIRWV